MGKIKKALLVLPLIATLLVRPVLATEFVITDNGSGSTNEVNTQAASTTTVTQTNEAEVTNNIATQANTGNNTASGNGGDVAITTGNIEENVQVTNAMNASTSTTPCCPSDISATISGNGEGSTNSIDMYMYSGSNVTVNNIAYVTNSVAGSGNTGGNVANNNLGSVSITTGNIQVASIISNDPVNVYETHVGEGGLNLAAQISSNGSGSVNAIGANIYGGSNVVGNNIFVLSNIVGWDLNTGNNFANGNVGDVSITTGNIVLDVIINNLGNIGSVIIDPCPVEAAPDPSPSPVPSVSPSPSPETTPTTTTSVGGAGSSGAGPSILGLSATSGLAANLLLALGGMLLMTIGFLVLTKKGLCKEFSLEFQFYY